MLNLMNVIFKEEVAVNQFQKWKRINTLNNKKEINKQWLKYYKNKKILTIMIKIKQINTKLTKRTKITKSKSK